MIVGCFSSPPVRAAAVNIGEVDVPARRRTRLSEEYPVAPCTRPSDQVADAGPSRAARWGAHSALRQGSTTSLALLLGSLAGAAGAQALPDDPLQRRCWTEHVAQRTAVDLREPTAVRFANLRHGDTSDGS